MKKYIFEVVDFSENKKGKVIFKCESNSATYIMRRRNNEIYSKDGMIWAKYFNCRQLINGSEAWEYDKFYDTFLYVPRRENYIEWKYNI